MFRHLSLALHYFRLGLATEMEYRMNFFIQLITACINLAVSLGGLEIIFSHTQTLNGWTHTELLALIGVYFLMSALIHTIIQPSLQKFMEDVRGGTLDFLLLKPVEPQWLVSVRQVQVMQLANVLLGAVVITVALMRMGTAITIAHTAAFLLALTLGLIIVYCFWLMLATLVFWFLKIDNILVIFESLYEAGRWPVGIYPAWLKFILTFVVPVAFVVTVPAEALAGRLSPQTLGIGVLLAVAMLVLSRWFWRRGLRRYEGASA
ncbi:MAG: ABC-2 family transporter protein [Verrucomicrobiota bacterium]|nr:ABC-2 family transporter protein [Verrucomicrobiota bacterium]